MFETERQKIVYKVHRTSEHYRFYTFPEGVHDKPIFVAILSKEANSYVLG